MATDYIEKNPPSDADIQAIYDENLPRLSGQQYKARHILVTTKEEAESVIAQLRQGSDFVALARGTRRRPDGPKRRRVGLVHAGFDAAAFRCGGAEQ